MEPAPTRRVEATSEFAGPWWLAVALLDTQSNEVVGAVLRTLGSLEIGPLVRAGTEGRLALRWVSEPPVAHAPTTGELRVAEIDGNRTELTLTGDLTGALDDIDDIVERLARHIETALAREIGTQ